MDAEFARVLDGSTARTVSPWPRFAAAWGVTAAAILLLFHRDARHLLRLWWHTSTFGHCLLIGPIIAWLVWQRRDGLREIVPQPWLPGAVLMIGGGILWLLGELAGVALVRHAALVLMLQATVPAVLGLTVSRALLFPLFYALFMIPVGEQLVPYLQTFTAHFSVWLLELVGIPAFLDGVFISVPNGDFEVAEACSGVRFLIAMIAFGVLVANVCFKSWPRRVTFVASAIVISILANGLRAWGTIYIASRTTPAFARGVDHIVYGWFFFALVMSLVLAAGWRFFDRPVDDPFIDPARLQPVAPVPASKARIATAAVAAILLAAAVPAYSAYVASRGPAATTAGLDLAAPPGWKPAAFNGAEWSPHYAGATATAMRSFGNGRGQPVEMYVAVFDRQSEKHELIGYGQGLFTLVNGEGGWGWAGGGAAPNGGIAAQINRGPHVRDAFVWYRVNGKTLGSVYAAKVEGLKAKLLGGDPQAAVVVVSAERADPLASARPALEAFARAMGPVDAVVARSIVARR